MATKSKANKADDYFCKYYTTIQLAQFLDGEEKEKAMDKAHKYLKLAKENGWKVGR